MNNPVKPSSQQPHYVTKFDVVPEFWQFLNGLKSDDIITELIQNDLDAGAEQTSIIFSESTLICEGDGQPVDDKGWDRLSFIRGAGDQVPRKQKRIGIKNHGLKACFTIGDEISIRSAGKYLNQTLYKTGFDQPPYPGAFDKPLPDFVAPATGCRIEVPYRLRDLETPVGEPLTFDATSPEIIERLFRKASQEIPQLFLGVLRPNIREKYVVIIEHHSLGYVRFEFKCGRLQKRGRMKFFSRICEGYDVSGEKAQQLREKAYFFRLPFLSDSKKEIPDFYSARNGFYGEIAWQVNSRGAPISSCGHLRYPITYAGDTSMARTGMGVHYSAPYISDLSRHGTSEASDRCNQHINEQLDKRLINLFRQQLIPRFGPNTLKLLIDPKGYEDERLKEMVELLLKHSSIPLAPKVIRSKGRIARKLKSLKPRIRFGPLKIRDSAEKRIVIPCYTWNSGRTSALLSQLCPKYEIQIHPSIPEEIVTVLADGECEGWKENHITFDENDVIDRLQPSIEGHFPWPNEKFWRAELGDPNLANKYLDVLLKRIKKGKKLDSEDIESLHGKIQLPDAQGIAMPYTGLYSGMDLPTDLPNVKMPPILHPKVADHPLFRGRNWKPRRYQFRNVMEDSDLENASYATRHEFWQWVLKKWKKIPKNMWPRLTKIPIWPDQQENLWPLHKLCYPNRARVRTILSEVLSIPSKDIFKLPLVKMKGRGRLKIRTQPSQKEISDYYLDHLNLFSQERALTENEQKAFHVFEENNFEISRDKGIAEKLMELSSDGLALNQEGYLLPCETLHRVNREIDRVKLLKEDLIDRPAKKLDKVFPPRNQPALHAIVRALRQDSEYIDALSARLDAYIKAIRREEEPIEGIEDIRCIPVDGNLYAPSELAFLSNKGDYWGSWKIKLSGKGLSADIQKLYRQVGVTSAEPKPHSSRQFFGWLNEQNDHFILRHLDCIIRHFNHTNGVLSWCDEYPDIPCLPVEHDRVIRLVPWQVATNPRGPVLLPDFPELAEAIRNSEFNPKIMLAVISHPKIRKPIADLLRGGRVKSLREYASQPIRVYGESEIEAPAVLLAELEKLRSHRLARELRKRLTDLDVNMDLLRNNWQNRLQQIYSLKLASKIHAKYKIGRSHYDVVENGAFCENTGTLWLTDGENNLESAFYRTLSDRVFADNAPKWVAAALRDALQTEFHDQIWSVPGHDIGDYESEDSSEYEPPDQSEEYIDNDDPGETMPTHKPKKPDFTKNIPNPGPIPGLDSVPIEKTTKHPGGGDKKRNHEEEFTSEVETIQKQNLKEKQYAWHCQLCLAKHDPEGLAPAGSYVEFQENRRKFIEAQHADQKHAGGARHAGNMLILCHFHHHRYGNAISRADVTQALSESTIDRKISFSTGSRSSKLTQTISGLVATVTIPHTAEKVRLFFTKGHRDYWLEKAGRSSG